MEVNPDTAPGFDDPARTAPATASTGRIRGTPADFRVVEELGFEPSGEGPHCLLRVEKTGLTTPQAAKRLAALAGVAPRDVGYCGLKDKHAVAEQWFSVPYTGPDSHNDQSRPDLRVVERHRHHRKLKRGAHVANRFSISIALERCEPRDLERRLGRVRDHGVPNYFGEQRFGRRYAENAARLAAGARLPRLQRSMTLSALRAALFNRVLDHRVRNGSWQRALEGEYVNLDGTRSGFAADIGDPAIAARIAALDLHPTGPLLGRGRNPASGAAAAMEAEVLRPYDAWCGVLAAAGLKLERRPTRCVPRDCGWDLDAGRGVLELGFTLGRGQFATAVLREILDYRDMTRVGDDGGGTRR